MDKRKQVKVLQGEASESDEEPTGGDEQLESPNQVKENKKPKDVKVVSGEASESDSDQDDETTTKCEADDKTNDNKALDINAVLTTESIDVHTNNNTPSGPKYKSLLQQKLRDRNQLLRNHLKKIFSDVYSVTKKEVDVITQQLCKSHMTIQDTSHNMKLVTSDLEPLQEKLDIIVNCNILPNINV